MLRPEAYGSQLETLLGAIDPSFEDEHGRGAPAILSVGTCGPDVPGRRSYHLVWTAAASEGRGAPERLIASFEFALDDGWWIGLWFLDTAEGWEDLYDDPFVEVGCEGGRHPWRTMNVACSTDVRGQRISTNLKTWSAAASRPLAERSALHWWA